MTIRIPLYNIKLIDFTGIFQKHIEPDLLSELDEYKLISDGTINLRSKDVKRVFFHHIIFKLCNYIMSVKGKDKIVIIYSNLVPPDKNITNFVSVSELQIFLNRLMLKIIKILPLKILMSPTTFNKIRSDVRRKQGNSAEIINSAISTIENHDISRYTFSRARSFSKRYGLTFLSNNFFKQIKCKQLILS